MLIMKNEIEKKIKCTWGFLFGKLTNSGSEAIKFALINAKIKKGTYIAVPVTICKSVVDEIIEYGCLPFFIDVDNDFCLDYQKLVQGFNNKISAVIYVYAYGILKDVSNFVKFCNEYNIILIEDSAQYVCAKNRYKQSSQGDFVIYSFGKGKPIDVGCYGFIASNLYEIDEFPSLYSEQKLSVLSDKFDNIKNILKEKLEKVKIYKRFLNKKDILDKPCYLDNIYHRLLFYKPLHYYEISEKMYKFMDKNHIDNYQSTIPVEAFCEPNLQKLMTDHTRLNLNYFKNYKCLKSSYHYFRTCDWINEDNILEICNYFNKIVDGES